MYAISYTFVYVSCHIRNIFNPLHTCNNNYIAYAALYIPLKSKAKSSTIENIEYNLYRIHIWMCAYSVVTDCLITKQHLLLITQLPRFC